MSLSWIERLKLLEDGCELETIRRKSRCQCDLDGVAIGTCPGVETCPYSDYEGEEDES